MFDPATHRDFLGSILGTGIVRDKIGDIIVMGEQGAQILTVPELVGHFETSLTQVMLSSSCRHQGTMAVVDNLEQVMGTACMRLHWRCFLRGS